MNWKKSSININRNEFFKIRFEMPIGLNNWIERLSSMPTGNAVISSEIVYRADPQIRE